jgi:hypothetical protein
VACPALPYFSTLSHKRHDFWKKLLNIKCVTKRVLVFSKTFYEIFLFIIIILGDIIINVHWSSCRVRVILARYLITLEFPLQILEKYANIKLHENLSSESRVVPCGRTDRRTEMTKLIVAFRNFVNEPTTPLNNARISLFNNYFGELRSEKSTSGFQLRTSLRSTCTLRIRRHRRLICVSKKRLHL